MAGALLLHSFRIIAVHIPRQAHGIAPGGTSKHQGSIWNNRIAPSAEQILRCGVMGLQILDARCIHATFGWQDDDFGKYSILQSFFFLRNGVGEELSSAISLVKFIRKSQRDVWAGERYKTAVDQINKYFNF